MQQGLSLCCLWSLGNFLTGHRTGSIGLPLCVQWEAYSNVRTNSQFLRSSPFDGKHNTRRKNHEALKPYPAMGRIPGMACGGSETQLYGEGRASSQIPVPSAGGIGGMWVQGKEEGEDCRQSTCMSRDLGVGQAWDKKMASPAGSGRAPERVSMGKESRKVPGPALCPWWGLIPACRWSGSIGWPPPLPEASSGRDSG